MRTFWITLAVVTLGAPAFAQSSGRLGPSKLSEKYPKETRVYAESAKASSTYGKGYTAKEACGAPDVFPKFKDTKRSWTVKNKRSKSDWIELTFPSTKASALIVFETWKPGAITKITVDGEVVFEDAGKPKRYREAQGLWVELGATKTVQKVKVEVSAARVGYYPEIDAVALVRVGAAPPRGRKKAAQSDPSEPEEPNLIKARLEVEAVAKALPNLTPGDVAACNVQLRKLTKANEYLRACTNRKDPRRSRVARRVRTLDAEVRNIARQPAPKKARPTSTPKPTGPDEPKLVEARKLFDSVEAKMAKAATKEDVNELIRENEAAKKVLLACKNQGAPNWAVEARRANELYRQLSLAFHKKPSRPKPKAKPKPKPTKPTSGLKALGIDPKAPAIGAAKWLGPEVFGMRTKAEGFVYATKATASSTSGRSPDSYSAKRATGAPDVFPACKDSPAAWAPKTNYKVDWLEVSFPKTTASVVYIFQNRGAGTVRAVADGSGAVLFRAAPERKKRLKVNQYAAQVLAIRLPAPRAIDRLKIVTDGRLGKHPEIDAVALGAKGMSSSELVFTAADSDSYKRAVAELKEAHEYLAKHTGTYLKKKKDETHMFEFGIHGARRYIGKIQNKRHPKVLQLVKDLAAFEAKVAKRVEASRKELTSQGGVEQIKAQAAKHKHWLKIATRTNKGRLVPAPPREESVEVYRAYGLKLKAAIADVERKIAFLENAERVVPGGVSSKLEIRDAKSELKQRKDPVGGDKETALAAQSIDPRNASESALRSMAFDRKKTGVAGKLHKAILHTQIIDAFETSFYGKPNAEFADVRQDLQNRLKALNGFIDAQIAKERLTVPAGGQRLIKIAKGHLKDVKYIGLSTPLKTSEGVWKSKTLVDTTEMGGGMQRKRYKVTERPYKIDTFWVAVARPDPERPGYAVVHHYGFKYYYKGGTPLRQWHKFNDASGYLMLVKNLPKD
jgi:hypothetical protein